MVSVSSYGRVYLNQQGTVHIPVGDVYLGPIASLHLQQQFQHAMVLELGAGIGLVAIAAAEASCVVVATDCDTVFIALATCKRNAARHHRADTGGSVRARWLDWSDPHAGINRTGEESIPTAFRWTRRDSELLDSHVDWIVASDVFYDDEIADHFLDTLHWLRIKNPNARAVITTEKRVVFSAITLSEIALGVDAVEARQCRHDDEASQQSISTSTKYCSQCAASDRTQCHSRFTAARIPTDSVPPVHPRDQDRLCPCRRFVISDCIVHCHTNLLYGDILYSRLMKRRGWAHPKSPQVMPPPLPAHALDWVFLVDPSTIDDGSSDKCLLFTDAYGRLMQVMLAATALVIMYIKRKLETPMRPLRVWALDIGKQCCGAFLIHCLSILLSIVFVAGAGNNDDECGVYFVTYMLDTTWGVLVILALLRLEHAVAEKMEWQDLVESGFYGEPPQSKIWAKQLAAYAFAVLVMKSIDSCIILWYYEPLAAFGTDLFRSFSRHRHLELLLVMIIIPGCCNSFQFWIVDSYLKCDGSHWRYFTVLVTRDDEREGKTTPTYCTGQRVPPPLAPPPPPIVGDAGPVLLLPTVKTVSYDAAASMANAITSRPEHESEATN